MPSVGAAGQRLRHIPQQGSARGIITRGAGASRMIQMGRGEQEEVARLRVENRDLRARLDAYEPPDEAPTTTPGRAWLDVHLDAVLAAYPRHEVVVDLTTGAVVAAFEDIAEAERALNAYEQAHPDAQLFTFHTAMFSR